MDVLWVVNTNTFLLVILILMVSYLTLQVSALIRFFNNPTTIHMKKPTRSPVSVFGEQDKPDGSSSVSMRQAQ